MKVPASCRFGIEIFLALCIFAIFACIEDAHASPPKGALEKCSVIVKYGPQTDDPSYLENVERFKYCVQKELMKKLELLKEEQQFAEDTIQELRDQANY